MRKLPWTLARVAARRRGLGDHHLLLRRANVRIGVAIWRRAAAMVRSCLPQPSNEDVTMIFGLDPAADPDDAASDCDGPLASNLVASEGLAFMAA